MKYNNIFSRSKYMGINKQNRLACSNQYRLYSPDSSFQHLFRLCFLLSSLLVFSTCGSTTVLLSNFSDDTIRSPPASTQATGTVTTEPGAGKVIVVAAPNPNLPANKWAQISHPTAPSEETALTGNFSRFDGVGKYALLASLYIPSGTGIVTVQFETFPQGPHPHLSFLHLDFMPEGDVRIDDSNVRFGQFPRDQSFVLSVNLAITATTATAEIMLLGGNASGNTHVSVQPVLIPLARQFGAVKFWMGFQHKGTFFVDDILVTRKNS